MQHSRCFLARVKAELQRFQVDPPPGVACWPAEDADGNGDRIDRFSAVIQGPPDTPYEDGHFQLVVELNERYPMDPPSARFHTRVYHPNIDEAGRICLSLLKKGPKGTWTPASNLATLLMSIRLLLAEPNPDDPLLAEAQEYKENRAAFMEKARAYTRQYATANKQDDTACDAGSSSNSTTHPINKPAIQTPTLANNAGDCLGSTGELTTSTEPTDTASDTSSTFTQQLPNSQSNTVMAKRQQQRNMLSLLKRRRSAASDTPSSSLDVNSRMRRAIERSEHEHQQLTDIVALLHGQRSTSGADTSSGATGARGRRGAAAAAAGSKDASRWSKRTKLPSTHRATNAERQQFPDLRAYLHRITEPASTSSANVDREPAPNSSAN